MAKRNPDLTRQNILEAAFREIHLSGFQAASLEKILAKAGVTKGALYHHFPDKMALGYAVVDEVIREYMLDQLVRPLEGASDPLDGLLDMLTQVERDLRHIGFKLGCPLNNLAQEMSPIDEGFRRRLDKIYQEWRGAFNRALKRAQDAGLVRADIDPEKAAPFLVAAMEGIFGTTKNAQSMELFHASLEGLKDYIRSLRAEEVAA